MTTTDTDNGATPPPEQESQSKKQEAPTAEPREAAGGDEDKAPSSSLVIVGIGASAGGFEAFKDLLEGLPATINFAIVFLQHRKADNESVLPELLRNSTK